MRKAAAVTVCMVCAGAAFGFVRLPAAPGVMQAGRSGVEQDILKAMVELEAALDVKPDPAAAARLLSDSYITTHVDGTIENKAQVLARISPARTRQPRVREDVKVQVLGDVAVITGQFQLVNNEGARSDPRRFTEVWGRKDGRWQGMAYQSTEMPKPPRPASALAGLRGILTKADLDALDRTPGKVLLTAPARPYQIFANTVARPNTTAEMHPDKDEIFLIIGGSAQFTLGGTITDAKKVNPETEQGTVVTGGDTKPVGVGSLVSAPRGTPHRFDPGTGHVTYVGIAVLGR